MKQRVAYLESHNHYNFRHGEEDPKIIGVVNYKPDNLPERPCFKVEYESDNKIDFVPISEVIINEYWSII